MLKRKHRILIECPGCKIPFYAHHGNRQFCSTNCYNHNYNNLHRDKSSAYLSTLNNNIKILQALIGAKNEIVLPYSEFENHGFDFRIYSEKVPDKSNNFIFHLVFGPYITNLTSENLFNIKLK